MSSESPGSRLAPLSSASRNLTGGVAESTNSTSRPAPRSGANATSLEVVSTVMGALGLAFIIGVFLLFAFNERQTLFREARDHARNTAFFLADHGQRLFEVSDIALRSTVMAIGTMDWDAIEQSTATWNTLRNTNDLLPYVDNIWLNDEAGRLRLTTFAFPSPVSTIADRPSFARIKAAGDQLVIGERIVGRLTKKPTFLVARRLTNNDGSLRGVSSVTLELAYFINYWQRLDLRNDERLSVVRAGDGDVLTTYRDGVVDEIDSATTGTLLSAISSEPEAGSFQPAPGRFGFYQKVGALPLYITVEFSRASVLAAWHNWLLRLMPLVAAILIGLASIMMLGRRQGRREAAAAAEIAAAQAALAEANSTLERRVGERTADLEGSAKEIQRFAYIVSHDLRAPLVNITGFTSELDRLRDSLFAEIRPGEEVRRDFDEAIGFIQSSVVKMDGLIRAVLTLSREGRRNFHPETIDLNDLLQSIVDGEAHQVQTAGAIVWLDPLPQLTSDRAAIEQIFANVVNNAVKYLRAEVPGEIAITGLRHQNRVTVRVADNGRGIDTSDRERVFEMFRRAGPQDRPGDGIGLAHVRSLLKRLGGTIALESTPGGGCTFVIEVPDMKLTKVNDTSQ